MARIEMNNIAHQYPSNEGSATYALKPMNLEWDDGGAYALLGPSGCGKTTLLNVISGLLTPSEGRVLFNGENVTGLAPQKRNIAQVFQFPVIYDTMTVAENLEFPLRNHGVAAPERKQRVKQILELLDLTPQANEKARHLSADSKQKISLGRGLVRTNTNAVLFDEPLTVIDPALKWQLRAQLKKVHQQVGHTMIYVTHDQTEALTFADKVVVMLEGEVLQVGTPQELFERPEHTFVGRFIGSPGMNILSCSVRGENAVIDGQTITLSGHFSDLSGRVELGVRPENVQLTQSAENPNAIPVKITRVDDLGRRKIIHMQLQQQILQAVVAETTAIPQSPAVTFDPQSIHIYRNSVRVPPSNSGKAA